MEAGVGNTISRKQLFICVCAVFSCVSIVLMYNFNSLMSQAAISKDVEPSARSCYTSSPSYCLKTIASRVQFMLNNSIQWRHIGNSDKRRKTEFIQDDLPSSKNSIQDTKQSSKTKFVIILAYMHTSSSYTASVINQYPESVMYGEPLEHIAHMIASSSSLYMLNGTITQPLYANNLQSYGIRYLTNLFLCQLWNIDVLTLWKYNSKHISTLWQCPSTPDISVVKRGKLAADFNDVTNGLKSCSPKLVSLCNGASLRATKTIRMSMSMVRDVFAAFKNLKIIHLLRDPRAMLDSNVRRHEIGVDVNIDKFKRRAREICKLMLNDLRESSILKMSYPGQILTARYEDMVDDPILSAKRMYEFLDIPFTRSVHKYVQQRNSNSGTRSALWRTHISKEHLEIVNQHCSELYKELGYPKFDTLDEVRNLDITGYTSIGHE